MKVLPEFGKAIETAMSRSDMLKQDILQGVNADLLFVYSANPVYALPEQVKAGFTVAFDFVNTETTAAADLVLPIPHPYERFDDLASPYGVAAATYSLGAPVSKATLNVMSAADFVLGLADLGFETFEEVLEAKVAAIGADMDELKEGAAYVLEETPDVSGVTLAANVLGKAAVPVKYRRIGTGSLHPAQRGYSQSGHHTQRTVHHQQ